MMVVVTVSCCPPKLRGDLTKWLMEIDTGVFVGNLSARVRDAVWDRICSHIGNGRATMAYHTDGEQKLDFRIHNTDWEPVDYDGIKLVRRRYPEQSDAQYKQKSNVMQQHINRLVQRKQAASGSSYVVIDLETTGLQASDHMIELGALRVTNGQPEAEFTRLIRCPISIPETIRQLTGITDDLIQKEGIEEKIALEEFRAFCGDSELIGHHIQFDLKFLRKALMRNGLPMLQNKSTDTMQLSRRKLDCDNGYGLTAVADTLGIPYERTHRALADCELAYRIFEKLKET